MSRINTNVSALVSRNSLARSNADLQTRLQRLSTGLQINRGADNPAGLIVSERLRSEIQGVSTAIGNSQRASNVIATAEAALSEVSDLLNSIKGLIVEAANTGAFSDAEIKANQLQIDSAIESITRISNTTSFAGLKLLNGSLDYITSGVNSANIQDVRVYSANFGTQSSLPVSVEVLNSAEQGSLFLSTFSAATTSGQLLSSVTFEVTGTTGVQVFSFVSGTALSAVAFAVNQVSDSTGVTAALVSATNPTSGLVLTSQGYGSDSFVSVRKLTGGAFLQSYDAKGGNNVQRDGGEDVLALVNGSLALGKGTNISLHSATMTLEMNLTVTAAQTLGAHSFSITGGGANYQIGGSVNSGQQVGFGLKSAAASHLGNEALGFLSSVISGGQNSLVAGSAREASLIIDEAIDQISGLRGRLGAFERNTLQTAIRSQQIAMENLTTSESAIRDADFAAETSAMSRAQILVSAGTSTLAISNSTAQSVLQLLQ